MTDLGTAPGKQLTLPLAPPEGEAGVGERRRDAPSHDCKGWPVGAFRTQPLTEELRNATV